MHLRYSLILLLFFAGTNLFAQTAKPKKSTPQRKGYELLAPSEFNKRIQSEPGIILDVRTPGEQKKGMLSKAVPMDIFADNFDASLQKLDKSKTYYVYCASGGRSAEASEKMIKLGFTHVVDMDGGFMRWSREGLPISK